MFKKKETKKIEKVEKEKTNIDKPKKKFNKKYLIVFILIFLILCISLFYLYKNNFFKNEFIKIEDTELEKDTQTNNYDSEIYDLREKINNFNSKIKDLEYKIDNLENKFTEYKINPTKNEIIRVSLNIKDKIKKNINFDDDLKILTSLSKNEKNITSNIIKLEANKKYNLTSNTIKKDFEDELINFSKKNNLINNKFLSNYITITKIKNVKENSNEYFVLELKNHINTQNYITAFELLNSNEEIKKYFENTYKDLEIKNVLETSINNIINYILNND